MENRLYSKTPSEINAELSAKAAKFGTKAASIQNICKTYVIDNNGKKWDTWDLTTSQIAKFYIIDGCTSIMGGLHVKQFGIDFSTLKRLRTTYGSHFRGPEFIRKIGGEKLLEKAKIISEYKTYVEEQPTSVDKVIDNMANFERGIVNTPTKTSRTK